MPLTSNSLKVTYPYLAIKLYPKKAYIQSNLIFDVINITHYIQNTPFAVSNFTYIILHLKNNLFKNVDLGSIVSVIRMSLLIVYAYHDPYNLTHLSINNCYRPWLLLLPYSLRINLSLKNTLYHISLFPGFTSSLSNAKHVLRPACMILYSLAITYNLGNI